MHTRAAVMVAAAVALLTTTLFLTPQATLEAQGSAAALAGEVSSKEEGKMEGVAVTAEREGAGFRISVYSNAQGRYTFPRSRVTPGKYTLTVRAAGYDLAAPASVNVVANQTATANLALQKAADITRQLTSREWITSAPGSDEIKNKVVAAAVSCTYCHSLERVVKTKYTAEQWMPVLHRMHKYFVDGSSAPQGTGRGHAEFESEAAQARNEKNPEWFALGGIKVLKTELAEYLASINLSGGRTQVPFAPAALPRAKGPSTQIVVTTWDAPRKNETFHDAVVDSKGRLWYSSETSDFVGMLDPKTGAFTDYPVKRAEQDAHLGARDLFIDKSDNLWLPMRLNNGSQVLYKFDTTTHESTPVAGFTAGLYGEADPDGVHVWHQFVRVDAKTAKVDGDFRRPTGARPSAYGFAVNSKGNPYGTDFMGSGVTAVDVVKNEGKAWPAPRPNVLPRRGSIDAQDRFWMGFYGGDAIAMFDTRSEKWSEWRTRKFTTPYTATVPDRNGYVYSSSHTAELLLRLDPKAGTIVEYPMPTTAGNFDTKRISFDPTAKNTVVLFANTRNAQIMRVEFPE